MIWSDWMPKALIAGGKRILDRPIQVDQVPDLLN
jgi:hypothetical protein